MRNAICARTETSKVRRKWPYRPSLYCAITLNANNELKTLYLPRKCCLSRYNSSIVSHCIIELRLIGMQLSENYDEKFDVSHFVGNSIVPDEFLLVFLGIVAFLRLHWPQVIPSFNITLRIIFLWFAIIRNR
jgi:hypothetical protein